MTGIFLQLSRVLPDQYPLPMGRDLSSDELSFGRLLDFGVIVPRLQQLYEWSAHELDAPELLACVQEGSLIYAWPYEDRSVWHATSTIPIQIARRMLPPGGRDGLDRNRSHRWPCCHPVEAG